MIKSFFLSKQYGPYAWLMGFVICTISWYSVELSVTLNQWNREIYDTLQQLNEERFWDLLLGWDWGTLQSFITLQKNAITDKPIVPSLVQYIIFFIPIAVYFTWQTQRFLFKWRQANTEYYLKRWENCPIEIEGASQRIQEDLHKFGKTLEGLFINALKSVLTLIAFIPILWTLSEGLPIYDGKFIPGFLVWIALAMSVGGTLLSVIVAWKLPSLEFDNQVVEAKFRKQLVLGEDSMKHRLVSDLFPMFDNVRRNYYRLFNWYMGLSVWQTAFGILLGNVALIALAPAFFAQLITLGVFFQVLNAFSRVESSMTFFVDSWSTIVDFMSVVKRLRQFNKALDEGDKEK
jgi:peptide/bleomycin uptake transporter